MKDLKLPIYTAVTLIAILLSAMVGYHFGKLEGESTAVAAQVPASTSSAGGVVPVQPPVAKQSQAPQQPKAAPANQISPEALAKEKGIPVSVTNSNGKYTLVSVVESADLNQKLSENLQLVTMQRQKLGSLVQQFDKAPVQAVQQRELIAGKVHEVRNALNQNLQLMARGYGYTLSNAYLRVPYNVSLMFEEKVGEKVELKLMHEFKTSEQYDSFQNGNNSYIKLKQQVALLTEAPEEKRDEPKEVVVPEAETDAEVAPPVKGAVAVELDEKSKAEVKKLNVELDDLRKSMMEMYKYDPEKQYKLIFNKSALYAKPA